MSEIVPRDWLLAKLKDISALTKGLTYSSADYSDDKNGLAFLTLKSISKDGGYSPFGLKFYKGEFKEHHTIKIGDVLFANTDLTRDGDVVGSPLFFDGFNINRTTLYSMDLSKLAVDPGKVHSKFLYYSLMTHSVKRYMINSSAGSTVLHLDTNRVKELELKLPSLPEQKIIASILTSVDEVIENTQKQINKLQDLKKATMNELLTKGIGHTEFKDSELGRIPKIWEVKTLGEVLDRIVGGGTPSRDNPNFWGNGIPWATVKDFTKKRLTSTQESITQEGLKNSSSNLIPKGTIIISTRMAVGKAVIFDKDVTINQDLKALFPKPFINTEYLLQWFDFKLDLIEALGIGSTVKGIRLEILRNISFLTPPLDEQIEVSTILNSIENQIYIKNQEITKIRSIKKSLMQDLLTGKTRVKAN